MARLILVIFLAVAVISFTLVESRSRHRSKVKKAHRTTSTTTTTRNPFENDDTSGENSEEIDEPTTDTRVEQETTTTHKPVAKDKTDQLPPNKVKKLQDWEIKQHPRHRPKKQRLRATTATPVSFDARVKWAQCKSIGEIQNQAKCGDCWAVSAASVASDRICIASGQTIFVNISANQAAGCSMAGYTPADNCNAGGDPSWVYRLMSTGGLASGGSYDSRSGCVPYSVKPGTASDISCATTCSNTAYPIRLPDDQKKYQIDSYYVKYRNGMTQDQINTVVQEIKNDIYENGPVTATFTVFGDFQKWNASRGVYRGPASSAKELGGHAVRIIGWNVTKEGEPYWLISNSWGNGVGDRGLFWILMGKDVCGIESGFSAPIVKVDDPCAGVNFCSGGATPIDQAFSTDIKNPAAPIYVLRGECAQSFKISGTQLIATGNAAPTERIFLNAPPGPITANLVQDGQFFLINDKGKAAACTLPAGATKTGCTGASGSASPVGVMVNANFFNGTAQKWTYQSSNPAWLFDTKGTGFNIGRTISDYFFVVTSILNLDGKTMMVFGRDASGVMAIAGVLPYPTKSGATLNLDRSTNCFGQSGEMCCPPNAGINHGAYSCKRRRKRRLTMPAIISNFFSSVSLKDQFFFSHVLNLESLNNPSDITKKKRRKKTKQK